MGTIAEGTPIPFEKLLIEATFSCKRGLRNNVNVIDLGECGKKAEDMKDISELIDGNEHRVDAVVTNNSKLILMDEVIGNSRSVRSGFKLNLRDDYKILAKKERQEYFFGAPIHNHTAPMPPSPDDLGLMFLEDSHPWGQTALLISTEYEKIAVFRGEQTPEWSLDCVNLQVQLWMKSLDERVMLRVAIESLLRGNELGTERRIEINRLEQMLFFHKMISEYDLKAFSCPLRENIARRMIFS